MKRSFKYFLNCWTLGIVVEEEYCAIPKIQSHYNLGARVMAAAPPSIKPKGYNSNYNYFQRETLKDVAIEFPNLKDKDHKRVVSRRWHELSNSDKMKLKELADCDKARYCREVQIYNESFPEDRIVPRINPPDGREVPSQDRFHSAYNHYMHQEKEFLLQLIPSNERKSKLGKYASVRWRHMEEDERQLYQDLEKHA